MPCYSKEVMAKGLKILSRKQPLDKQDWVDLVTARKELIKPYLDKISLRKLGDLEWFITGNHPIREVFLNKHDSPADFEIQGYFKQLERRFIGEDGEVCVTTSWCLTRAGGWLIFQEYSQIDKSVPVKWAPTSLLINHCASTEEFLDFLLHYEKYTAAMVWEQLGVFVKLVAQERKRLYEEFKGLEDIIIAERSVISLVPKE